MVRARAEAPNQVLAKAPHQRATIAAVPARTFALMLIACAMALSGCGFADQFASFMPKGFREPTPEPPAPEVEPDVKELIRANADTLFTARPGALAVAPPKRITGRGFSVCVKAVVAGPITPSRNRSRSSSSSSAVSSPTAAARRRRTAARASATRGSRRRAAAEICFELNSFLHSCRSRSPRCV